MDKTRLAKQKVVKNGSIKWATVAGIFLGAPAYALTHGVTRTIQLVYGALDWLVAGPFEFVAGLLDVAFVDAVLGIRVANVSFVNAVRDAGILAPIFAGAGTVLTVYLIYRGVTAYA